MILICLNSILILLQKMSVWSMLLQNGTSAFAGSFCIDFTADLGCGHAIKVHQNATVFCCYRML